MIHDAFAKHPLLAATTAFSASAVTLLEQLNLIFRVVTGALGVAVIALTLALKWREWRHPRG
jgi:hypothetical protein